MINVSFSTFQTVKNIKNSMQIWQHNTLINSYELSYKHAVSVVKYCFNALSPYVSINTQNQN